MSSTSPILTFAIRGTQALFAIVVFALSCSLIKGHHFGSLPSTLGFVAFVGGLSFIGVLFGIAAHWTQVLQSQVGVLIDAVVAGINIGGGIVSQLLDPQHGYILFLVAPSDMYQLMAIKLKGVSCKAVKYKGIGAEYSNDHKMVTSDIIYGGMEWTKKDDYRGFSCFWLFEDAGKHVGTLLSRCNMSKTDSVFMFLTAIVVAVAAVLGYLRMKRGY